MYEYLMQTAIFTDALIAPFIVSMIGVGIAIVERGYKRFQDEKATNPDVKFGVAYIMNMLLTAGGVAAILAIITAVIAMLKGGETSVTLDLFSMIAQLGAGYFIAYRILDGLNNRTEKKIEAANATPTPS